MPPIRWSAVLPGALISILFAFPGLTLVGTLGGGAFAGALARRDGAYHGGLVGVLTIVALALLPLPGPTDTFAIFAFDALLLAIGALAGWTGTQIARR